MARAKHVARKLRLASAGNRNQALPIWVVVRTLRKVSWRPRLRHWRRSKLKNV
ncbi:MAG: 50S ribosomal protein L39e [Zestosphaera sp.]